MSKKPTSTGSTPKTSRRKAATRKPVTIDLEAEAVKTDGAERATASTKAASAKAERVAPKASASSKPESAKSASDKAPGAGKKTTTDTSASKASSSGTPTKTDTAAKSEFGRNRTSVPPSKPTSSSPPSSPGKPVKRKGGFFGKLVAGFIGAVLALGGVWYMQDQGLLPSPGQTASTQNGDLDALRGEIATLRDTVTNAPAPQAGLDEAGVTDLINDRLAALPDSTPDPDAAAAADGRIAAMESELETLRGQLTAAQEQLAEMQNALSSGEGGETAGLAALTARLNDLAARVETPSAGQTDGGVSPEVTEALDARITGVDEAVTTLGEQVNSLQSTVAALPADSVTPTQLNEALSGLQETITAIETGQTELNATVENQAASVAALSERLENGADRRAAVALSAAALQARLLDGQSFASQLQTLRSASGEAEMLSELNEYAQSGVPTIADLQTRFAAVSDEIIAASEPVQEDAEQGTFARLLSGARSIVKVRPLNGAEQSGVAAQVQAIRSALASGEVAKALDEWNGLPDAGKAVSQDWQQAAQARLRAVSFMADTVQRLSTSTSQQ